MGRRIRTITIEHADRGAVIRVDENFDGVFGPSGHTEIVEGYGETPNFKDRVRRRLHEIVTEWYPINSR